MVVVANEGKLHAAADGLAASEEGAAARPPANRRTNSSISTEAAVSSSGGSTKSISLTEGKAVLNPDTDHSSSESDGSEQQSYLGKVPRGKTHRKMKRSLGSGFELHELTAAADCPPIILQLGPTHPNASGPCCHTAYTGNRSPPGSKGSPGTVSMSRESVGSASSIVLVEDAELPPEEQWRDSLLGGFCFGGGLCAISIPSLLCTTSALARLERAIGHSPGTCRQFLTLAVALLWLSVPAAIYLRAYPVAGAALLLVCAIEAAATCRLRGAVRRRFNIDGSACQDGVLSCLFTSCVAAQMLRHLHTSFPAAPAAGGAVRI